MDNDAFKRQVRKELEKLDREEIVHFAWRCAVRALPFLGSEGHFDFWKPKDRQKHLYAVFYAVDVSTGRAGVVAGAAAANIADTAAATTTTTATSATYAASAITNAAYASYNNTAVSTASIVASYTSRAANGKSLQNNIQQLILQDIKTGGSTDIKIYGKIWGNFQQALKKEGCEYWGKLYSNLFESGFELDLEAFERRINVPVEIRNRGAAAVAKYLEGMETKGAKNLNEARIIILGDKGAGKTCLARRLKDPDAFMTEGHESTRGVDTTEWQLPNEQMNIHIWDFAGHTVTHAAHQFFLSERSLYIIVLNGRKEEEPEYWLDHMKNYGGNSEAIILVNKFDNHTPDIPINSLRDKYPILKDRGFYIFSIDKDKDDLNIFRERVAEYIRTKPSWNNQLIPENYYNVKTALEELFATTGKENIKKEDFEKIAKENGVDNSAELLQNLHALGVCLWYKDIEEFDTLVLNPEWISHGVYKVINWVHEQKKHSISLQQFKEVFSDEDAGRYPENKHKDIFKLMKKYELAYEYRSNGERCLIIPHLLKEDRPDSIPDYPVGESLMLRYKADQPLPPNTISRFIVRHNEDIQKIGKGNYQVWRYGVVLEDQKGTIALVREEDRMIQVSMKGPNRTAYLDKLRSTLNDIFNSYKSDKPELQYWVERGEEFPQEIDKKSPLWVRDQQLLSHYINEQPLYDYISNQYIPVHITIHNYNITAESVITGGEGNLITRNTFNFKDCNINLQGVLNDLADSLKYKDYAEEAEEVEEVVAALESAEDLKTPEQIKKKGILNKVKRVLDDLTNEESDLYKKAEKIKKRVETVQKVGKAYNDIAQWVGLPQIPRPLLGE
ncbi:small GTP-binding protein [Parabacteroides sp. PF5-5]|uniref:COR domain-containing protein n=1 Tax=unclassified Parabacteroides TaxID=2649774 RepID=UPI0024735F30|nr:MULTISPECIES: COR domain-containing protein [unclassified Parabacteroides]MDH6303848.1 small GTP-binding protein [Parabacteroides sp. PH5-39]MDH6314465.1 small GTP-binding protein [Parabacteroides sp. PF5-13]MDH6318470.1 small GTP-binding protein [Parabacteroides sp. PH5-13]MDH6322237.1 small GTP-binding protein [Parabacteroides sp. PH5-8]MDH6325683.1 small GTP-binding protein [Parabacteroides sp. PH5-41]